MVNIIHICLIPQNPLLQFAFNPLSAKFIKWSNTLKQIVGKLPTICLSVFDHFSGLALKGLTAEQWHFIGNSQQIQTIQSDL